MGRYYDSDSSYSRDDSFMWWTIGITSVCALLCLIPIIWCICYKCRTRGPITPLPADYPRQVPIGGVNSSLSQAA